MIRLNLIWIFFLTTSILFGQKKRDIVGTYVMEEQIGIHVVQGESFGDSHPTSYISSVDTAVTHTLILDSLYNVTFIPDTLFSVNQCIPFGHSTIKMYGKWSFQNDTILIEYSSYDSVYNHLSYLPIEDTIVTYINDIEYKILPDKDTKPTPLESAIFVKFRINLYNKHIDEIVPINEKREWIKYEKQ